jgi:drug/metabolite transporter (DMT)-like permease
VYLLSTHNIDYVNTTGDTLKSLASVGFYQALTHASGVIALGAGAVSFTQVVKASEPAFTAAISAIFFKEFLPWQSYTALIPVMIGVSMASVTELSFSWFCLGAGVMANIFAAARGTTYHYNKVLYSFAIIYNVSILTKIPCVCTCMDACRGLRKKTDVRRN